MFHQLVHWNWNAQLQLELQLEISSVHLLYDTHRVSRSDEHAPIGDLSLLTLQVPPLQLQAPRQPQLHGHRMQQQQGGRGGAPLQQQHLPLGHQQHTAFSRAAAAQDAAQLTPKATGLGHTFPRSVHTISTDHVRVESQGLRDIAECRLF